MGWEMRNQQGKIKFPSRYYLSAIFSPFSAEKHEHDQISGIQLNAFHFYTFTTSGPFRSASASTVQLKQLKFHVAGYECPCTSFLSMTLACFSITGVKGSFLSLVLALLPLLAQSICSLSSLCPSYFFLKNIFYCDFFFVLFFVKVLRFCAGPSILLISSSFLMPLESPLNCQPCAIINQDVFLGQIKYGLKSKN